MALTISQSQTYWTQRIMNTFPQTWAGDPSFQPGGLFYSVVFNTAGLCALFAAGQISYTQLQTRIATATDQNLEAIANDFFGLNLFPRLLELNAATSQLVPESDAVYSSRIRQAIFGPKNTLAAIQLAVQNYITYQYVAEAVTDTMLFGLSDAGGLGTIGGLDGRPNSVPQLPSVYVFDIQSNPKLATTVGLTASQFCIFFSYGGLTTYGFFVGRSFLNRSDYLVDSKIQVISPLTSNLAAIVNKTRALGTVPVYADNRVA